MTVDTGLSVILAAHDYDEVVRACRHLAAQSIAHEMELVLIMPSDAPPPPADAFEAFGRVEIVRIPTIRPRSLANAAGVRCAHSPVVALTEDHVFVEEGWAEALLEDHQGPYVAVGPQVLNANKKTMISWADFVIGYGPWASPQEGGEVPFLPGHNTSYKRDALLEYGENLGSMLASETLLHWDLVAGGQRLHLSRKAKIRHMNFSLLTTWIRVQTLAGWVFAGMRATNWGGLRRIAYCAGSPLIPLVRAARLASVFRRFEPRSGCGPARRPPLSAFPMILLGLVFDAAGQAIGYAFGPGRSEETLAQYEFHRIRYVCVEDRAGQRDIAQESEQE